MTDPTPVTPPPAGATPPPASPAAAVAPATFPGKTLGIVGLILAFVAAPLGLILSIVAKVQSKGYKNTPATVGIVLGILFTVGYAILIASIFGALLAACAGLEPGTYQLDNGGTLTCG